MKSILIALAGNQSCGKTAPFNRLTSSNRHVGNFPGVTVGKRVGQIKSFKEAALVDLLGVYSLSPYTSEEVVTRDFVLKDDPDLVINIMDATNIERNPYLSLRLMELQRPVVIALNMMNEVTANRSNIDVHTLSEHLRCPIVPIPASKNEGINELIRVVEKQIRSGEQTVNLDFCKGEVHRAIHSVTHIIKSHAKRARVPMRFASTKLVEGGESMQRELELHQDDIDIIEKIVKSMEDTLQTGREAALVDMRYSYIEELVADCVVKRHASSAQVRSEKIDGLLTYRYPGIPIFILIMLCIFYPTFGPIGGTMQTLLEDGITVTYNRMANLLASIQVSDWLQALIVDGICNGMGNTLSFLPVIVTLLFFLSLLEDSGYTAQVAFVMDKLLRKIGLSDRGFVPMLIGFSCSVPAIMSVRTLSSERDRKMTIAVTPFMSCSTKLPIYGMITTAFFPEHTASILVSIYLIDILVAILSALLLKSTTFKGDSVPSVMKLPSYRIPSARSAVLRMWEKAKDFLRKTSTIISVASIIIWFLQSCDFSFTVVADFTDSMLTDIDTWILHMFAPLGFEDRRASTALVTGITAKESVVSTLSILTQANSDAGLSAALQTIFAPVSAFAYLCFTVLYMLCIAAFAAARRELGSIRQTLGAVDHQTLVTYLVAFLIFQIGSMFFRLNKTCIPIYTKGEQDMRV